MHAQRLFGVNFLAVKAGLTGISGAATTYSTGATSLQYAVGGKAATKAQASGAATPTTDFVTGLAITLTDLQARVVVWCVDVAGTVRLVAGAAVALDSAGNFVRMPEMPAVIPDTLTPIAYVVHKASGLAGTFTVGTSNWNTAGMTHTVVDVLVLPSRPQNS